MASNSAAQNRHVNHMLHTLRGEQFRHAQNLRKSKAHLSSSFLRNKATLPIDLTSLDYDAPAGPVGGSSSEGQSMSNSKCSGPTPPKSWTLTAAKEDIYNTVAWRSQALSLLYDTLGTSVDIPRPPPLTLMCLLYLISRCTLKELREDVLPFVPQHLRQNLVRYTSIHTPLPNSRLFALYEDESHANGEIVVVGPTNTIRDDHFIQGNLTSRLNNDNASPDAMEVEPSLDLDWDSEDRPPDVLLRTIAIASSRLSMTTLLSFPPTITHLALIRVSLPLALHRLPQVCPLLVFLDLSYNEWLAYPSKETLASWDRIDWGRWKELKVLGVRECGLSQEQLGRVNRGRWDDVRIVV